MTKKSELIIIAAIGKNNELGKNNNLIWNIPGDLTRFKKITSGHPVIMGYKTFESMNKRPLPNRTNIIMALDEKIEEDVKVACSQEEAIEIAINAPGGEKIFIIGGGMIYKLFLPIVDILNLTIVDKEDPEADIFFPEFDIKKFREISRKEQNIDDLSFAFVKLERINTV